MRIAAAMQNEDSPPRRWRLRTKILLTFGTVVAAVILALIVIPKKQYALLLSEKLVAQARAAGINVVISEPELRLRGFSARQISVFVPKILSTFNLTEVQVEMSPLALLSGTFRVAANANIFGGSISAAVNRALSGGDVCLHRFAPVSAQTVPHDEQRAADFRTQMVHKPAYFRALH